MGGGSGHETNTRADVSLLLNLITLYNFLPNSVEYPKTWQKQPKEGGKPVPCHKFDVPTGSAEYKDAIREFEATIRNANCTIIKVQRIQNPSEYAKHASFQQILQQKYGKKVEERRLFHGTRMDSIEAISYQGFNRIFAADANGKSINKFFSYLMSSSNYKHFLFLPARRT